MSVLIKGLQMPTKKSGAVLIIYPDGECAVEDGAILQAVELSPHGRLIDADALIVDLVNRGVDQIQRADYFEIRQAIADAPTIIEAAPEERDK